MKKTNSILCLSFLMIFLLTYSSKSVGIGFNFPISIASMVDKYSITANSSDIQLKSSLNTIGFGFVLDTKVAENALFNYRLNISTAFGTASFDELSVNGFTNNDPEEIKDLKEVWDLGYIRLSIDNTFGFGIVRSKLLRLWAGPQVRLGYTYGNTTQDITVNGVSNSKIHKYTGLIGFAPVIGANFNFGKTVTLTAETGYRYSIYAFGYMKFENLYDDNGRYTESVKYDLTGHEADFFFNVGLLFRLDDIYKK